jgi:hypothetical protein
VVLQESQHSIHVEMRQCDAMLPEMGRIEEVNHGTNIHKEKDNRAKTSFCGGVGG